MFILHSQIWIGIDFDKPSPKIFINHEIKAKQLKTRGYFIWVHLVFPR
jgi:hypothetical protein